MIKKKISRPLLVYSKNINSKLSLFKITHYIKNNRKYQIVNVSNDITKSEKGEERNNNNRTTRKTSCSTNVRSRPGASKMVKINNYQEKNGKGFKRHQSKNLYSSTKINFLYKCTQLFFEL